VAVRKYILGFSFLCFAHASLAQSPSGTDWNYETWWGIMTSTRVSRHWSIYADLHYSHQLFVAPRIGVTYHPKGDNFVTTVAYAYLGLTTPFSEGKLVRPEHRPWMQIVYRIPSASRFSASFRFKYDMRFIRDLLPDQLDDGYSLNHRWRFNNALRYRFNKDGAKAIINALMINEALITTGPAPNGVPYEHRTHLMGEASKGRFILSLGGMVRYLGKTPNGVRMTYGPVIWLTMNLNFSKYQTPLMKDNPEDHTE
jgi:hypothetical protein